MMRLTRTAALSLTVLFASVGTASAECAWVLWSASWFESVDGENGPARWEIVNSATAKADACEKARRVWITRHARDAALARENGVFVLPAHGKLSGSGFREWFRPICLPDTVDPRGRKGK